MVFKRAEILYKSIKGQNLAHQIWLTAKMFIVNSNCYRLMKNHNFRTLNPDAWVQFEPQLKFATIK